MHLSLKPITTQNRAQVLALTLAPEQAGFIESIEECLAQAQAERGWQTVGIYTQGVACVDGDSGCTDNNEFGADGARADVLIGFAMYKHFGAFAPFGQAWLDRLLIDRRYQGRGYGGAAVAALCATMRARYHCKRIYLSVYEDNVAAIRLYARLGFACNGKRDAKGELVMVAR